MKCGRNVIQVNMCRLKETDFRTFKMAVMTAIYAEKCCHQVSEYKVSAGAYAVEFRQFLIYRTRVLV